MNAIKVIGLMSGTSMDGIDVALITTDGERTILRGHSLTFPYTPERRAGLKMAMQAARRVWGLGAEGASPADEMILHEVEQELTTAHAEAVRQFMEHFGLARDSVALIGFHGQTVYHDASRGLTRQLGDGEALARATGIDVVYDFRSADVEAGGEGAPLVPAYHRALVEEAGIERPVVVVNLGGVANVTFVGAKGELLAFDVGPGNALLDDWVSETTGEPFDRDGALARQGSVDDTVLAGLMAHAFFDRSPPKSLDRNDFPPLARDALSPADGAATLVAFTAQALAAARDDLPATPHSWLLAGGGVHNQTLVSAIAAALDERVVRADEMGLASDHLEAEAFAYLAVRSLRHLPLTFPGTTGVKQPTTGGRLARAPRR